jgi:hypothetical protein
MNNSDVSLLAQLLTAMKEATISLEKYYSQRDFEKIEEIKRELLILQQRIGKIL